MLAALIVVGACDDPDRGEVADESSSSASGSASAGPTTTGAAPSRSPSPTPSATATRPVATTPPPPPPVTVEPFTFVTDVGDEPLQAPLPALPTAPGPSATLAVSAGWTGGLQTSGPQAGPFVRCGVTPPTPGTVGSLMYEVSSDGEFSEFVDVGEYYVTIVRHPGSGDRPIETQVEVYSRTPTDKLYEMWDDTGVMDVNEQQISVAASPDNRTVTFSAVTVPMTYYLTVDPDAAVTWALVQGTVACPEPPGAIPST